MRSEAELTVLRLLIARLGAVSERLPGRGDLLGQLSAYVWSDEEHRVVYECLRTIRRVQAIPLREGMAAEATRIGHPDVDWGCYFDEPAEDADVADLIRRLKTSTP